MIAKRRNNRDGIREMWERSLWGREASERVPAAMVQVMIGRLTAERDSLRECK